MYNKYLDGNNNTAPALQSLLQTKRVHNYQSDISAVDNMSIYIIALEKVLSNCEKAANFNEPQNQYGIYATEYLKLLENARSILREFVDGFLQIMHQMEDKEEVELLLRILNGMQQLLELFIMSKEVRHLTQLQSAGQSLLQYFQNGKEELMKTPQPANHEDKPSIEAMGCSVHT